MSVTLTEFHLNLSWLGWWGRRAHASSIPALSRRKEGVSVSLVFPLLQRKNKSPTSDCMIHSKERERERGRKAMSRASQTFSSYWWQNKCGHKDRPKQKSQGQFKREQGLYPTPPSTRQSFCPGEPFILNVSPATNLEYNHHFPRGYSAG